MATLDVRLERIEKEYGSLRGAQNRLMDKVDGFESAVLGLTEVVAENRELIIENRELITENRELILENREMLIAIIKHLDVPYEKPSMGFQKD